MGPELRNHGKTMSQRTKPVAGALGTVRANDMALGMQGFGPTPRGLGDHGFSTVARSI